MPWAGRVKISLSWPLELSEIYIYEGTLIQSTEDNEGRVKFNYSSHSDKSGINFQLSQLMVTQCLDIMGNSGQFQTILVSQLSFNQRWL